MPCYLCRAHMESKAVVLRIDSSRRDKDRLRGITNRSFATAPIAHCFHVHMRDAYVSSVLVQLFNCRLASSGDEAIHLSGIRDAGTDTSLSRGATRFVTAATKLVAIVEGPRDS